MSVNHHATKTVNIATAARIPALYSEMKKFTNSNEAFREFPIIILSAIRYYACISLKRVNLVQFRIGCASYVAVG